MANRKVSLAVLHSPIFVPNVGQLSNQVIPVIKGGPNSSGKVKELSMEWGDTTLTITVNGIEVGVPHANVQCATFIKE